MLDHLDISIIGKHGSVKLLVYPQSSNAKVFEEVDPQDGESRWQLVEREETEAEYKNVKWDIKQMITDGILGNGHASAEPRGISMAKLMKYVIHN